MVKDVARIRPLTIDDVPLSKFMIAKASMEGLASANVKTVLHPMTISTWVGLSCVFIQYMQWWPGGSAQWWKYLTPLPAFMALAAPILILSDWKNRPHFEAQTQVILRKPDIAELCSYYAKSPSSGFWILEYGDTFVGLISMDANTDEGEAVISHFHVEELYRTANAQSDLLEYALQCAFASGKIERLVGHSSTFNDYIKSALKEYNFRPIDENTSHGGLYRWNAGQTWELEKKTWSISHNSSCVSSSTSRRTT